MKKMIHFQRLSLLTFLIMGAMSVAEAQVTVVRRSGAAVVRTPVAVRVYRAPAAVRVARPVVVAPVLRTGVVVAALPAYYTVAYCGHVPYYFSNGVYYVKVENSEEYKVVLPPIGTIVPELPDGAVKNKIDGTVYFEFQGVLYKKVKTTELKGYQVVGYVNPSNN